MTTTIQPTATKTRKWIIAFYVPIVLIILLMVMFLAVLPPIPILFYLFIGWANPLEALGMHHHHLHVFMESTIFLLILLGCIVQFFRPKRKAAPMLQAAIAIFLMTLVAIVTSSFDIAFLFFLVPIMAAVALHPSGFRTLFQPTGKFNLPLLALTAVAAIPLALYALEHLSLQASQIVGDDHGELNHWGVMATLSFSLIAFGLLAVFRLHGWRITAWSASVMAFVLGLTSLAFPAQASAVSPVWGVIAIIWSLAFALATQFGDRLVSARSG